MADSYDRSLEDIGNIVALEHVNLMIPDQRLGTLFYVQGLGLTRDPYLNVGVGNMWINVGRSQFHLPTGEAQKLRGLVGIVMPDLDGLLARLDKVREPLADTAFDFAPANDHVAVTCPWGNRLRVHGPDLPAAGTILGIPYLEIDVPEGAASGIARFYEQIMDAPASVGEHRGAPAARVQAGAGQSLIFRETDATMEDYDGHHIQVYITDFSGPYRRLGERGLISQEDGQHQYRFKDIVDPESGRVLFTLEHEVRSMTHPLYARPLVNRNPDQTNFTYAPGYSDRPWAAPYDA